MYSLAAGVAGAAEALGLVNSLAVVAAVAAVAAEAARLVHKLAAVAFAEGCIPAVVAVKVLGKEPTVGCSHLSSCRRRRPSLSASHPLS